MFSTPICIHIIIFLWIHIDKSQRLRLIVVVDCWFKYFLLQILWASDMQFQFAHHWWGNTKTVNFQRNINFNSLIKDEIWTEKFLNDGSLQIVHKRATKSMHFFHFLIPERNDSITYFNSLTYILWDSSQTYRMALIFQDFNLPIDKRKIFDTPHDVVWSVKI